MMRFTPLTKNLTKLLDIKSLKLLDHYAQFNPSPLSLTKFLEFGRCASEVESFHFLIKELPVRMSNIMKEINLLPSNLLQSPSLIKVQELYAWSFVELCAFDGRHCDEKTLLAFMSILNEVHRVHVNVVQHMAEGVLELKESHNVDGHTEMSIQYFLDRFYMSRISLRMLMQQHSFLFEPSSDGVSNRVGSIDPNTNVRSLVLDAYTHASYLCEEYYSISPDINITVASSRDSNDIVSIVYPPQHIYHILFELFKNAMRAVIETRKLSSSQIPDLEVLIAKSENDVTIKVSDQGGGIPRHITDNLFQYLFSTAPRPIPQSSKTTPPLAGYGYGLPLSRLYARYFHGDLILNSYDGYGTDAVVYLKAKTDEAHELLPVFNKTSSKHYRAGVPTADWTDPNCNMNRKVFFKSKSPKASPSQ